MRLAGDEPARDPAPTRAAAHGLWRVELDAQPPQARFAARLDGERPEAPAEFPDGREGDELEERDPPVDPGNVPGPGGDEDEEEDDEEDDEPPVDPGPPIDPPTTECLPRGPCLVAVEAFQIDFGPNTGIVSVTWRLPRGPFEQILVRVEGVGEALVAGDRTGVELPPLRAGRAYRIQVIGRTREGSVSQRTEIEVLAASPVPELEISDWRAYGFHANRRGVLELSLRFPDAPDVRVRDFEIFVDGEFHSIIDDHDGARVLRVVNVEERPPPQFILVEVIAFVGQHAAPRPARAICHTKRVDPPLRLACRRVDCATGDDPRAELSFFLPAGSTVDGLAVWSRERDAETGWTFLGIHPIELDLERQDGRGIPEGLEPVRATLSIDSKDIVLIEAAGVELLEDEDGETWPRFLSTVPRGPGPHQIVPCPPVGRGCEPADRRRFRRGDVDSNETIEITDAISILSYLFLGQFQPGCPDALDIDDDGEVGITDPIHLLDFMFLGEAGPPAAPGPTLCGVDPSPDDELDCPVSSCVLQP